MEIGDKKDKDSGAQERGKIKEIKTFETGRRGNRFN
jgi:hypothetical protein